MKTLVIHPKDRTTDFLKPIYHGRGYTVITGGCTKADVAKAIDEHDHIIMMGHGTPQGLLAVGQFNGKPKPTPKYTPKPSTAIRATVGGKPVTDEDIKDFYTMDEDDWFADRKVVSSANYGGNYSSWNNQLMTGYVIDDTNAEQLRGKRVTAIWCNADQYMEWNNLEGFYTGMFISDTSEARMIGTADTEQWQVDQQNFKFAEVVALNANKEPDVLLAALHRYYGPLAKHNAIAKYNLMRFYTRKSDVVTKPAEVVQA
jgi:hypothetical protein